jgi:hypothetical protein
VEVNLKDAALKYAANGWHILPLHNPTEQGCSCGDAECEKAGKHPRVRFVEASAEMETVAEWWSRWPTANIGLTLKNVVVLDADVRGGGLETLARLEAEHGQLDARARQQTGSGGFHYLFAQIEGAKARTGVMPGIDIRCGQNAIIVVEPSLHVSGGRYAWSDEPHPLSNTVSGIALPIAPEWVRRLAIGQPRAEKAEAKRNAPRTRQQTVEEHISKAIGKIAEGSSRNDAGFYLFCQMRDDSYNKTQCKGVIPEWVRRANLAAPGSHQYVAAEAHASLSSVFTQAPREPKEAKRPRREQETDALEKLLSSVQFFSDGKDGFARIEVNGHHECWIVTSDRFRQILLARYYDAHHALPGKEAMQDVINLCAFRAMQGSVQEVFSRIGHVTNADGERTVYLDLANDAWQAVEITASGWCVVNEPSVCFRRPGGMLSLPTPEPDGSLDELRPLINASNEATWTLICAWLSAVFQPIGAQPILLLLGGQGSAKSTTATLLRRLVDPNVLPLSGPPESTRDFSITALNSGVVAYDNLSGVRPWLSDALCRVASGVGFRTRSLYKDSEEQVLQLRKPLLLNGIDSVERNDLIDRCIGVTLERITEATRRTEREIFEAFDKAHSRILGVLLSVVSAGLKNIATTKLPSAPRMVDFAHWIVACEGALPWETGKFLEVYNGNRQEACRDSVDDDPFAFAVAGFAHAFKGGTSWCGTAQRLLEALSTGDGACIRGERWPRDAAAVGRWLRRAEPALRALGVVVTTKREGKTGTRKIWISYQPNEPGTSGDERRALLPEMLADLPKAA